MTFYKLLKKAERDDGVTVSAYQKQEKFSNYWQYEVTLSKGSMAYQVIPCARTTWQRKFREMLSA